MSDERFHGFDILHEALKDEHFRRRLTEVDELESQYEDQSFFLASRPLCIRIDGEEMTVQDTQRQTLKEAIAKSGFHDEQMQEFAEASTFEFGDVLRRAKALAARPGHPDVNKAASIVTMIRNFD